MGTVDEDRQDELTVRVIAKGTSHFLDFLNGLEKRTDFIYHRVNDPDMVRGLKRGIIVVKLQDCYIGKEPDLVEEYENLLNESEATVYSEESFKMFINAS